MSAISVAALTGLAVLAVFALLAVSSGAGGVPGAWSDLFADSDYLQRLLFSLAQATVATVIGLALGVPASWLLSRRIPARGLFHLAVAAPLAIPGVVLGLGVDDIADGRFIPEATIVAAHAVFATAAVVWLLTPAWNAGDPAASEAARLLGARRWAAWRAGRGREVPAGLRIAAALAFLYAFTAVGTIAVLGDEGTQTTEAALALLDPAEARGATGLSAATFAASALIQMAVGAFVLALGGLRWPGARTAPVASRVPVQLLGVLYLLALGAVLWAPLAVLVAEAASSGALEAVLTAPASVAVGGRTVASAFTWTGTFAALTAIGATALAWPSARLLDARGRRGAVFATVAVVPAVLTGAALGWAGLGLARETVIDLERTYLLTMGAHILIAYPFAVRIIASAARARDGSVEAARLLGAPVRRVAWRSHGRPLACALGAAALISAVISAGELAATNLLTPGQAAPGVLAVLRAVTSEGGADESTVAVAVLLATATVIAFACAEWLRRTAARSEVA